MSEATVPAVYAAITTVMARMAKEGISKGRKNQQQGYQFRGIDDVYNALSSVLAEANLVMLPFVRDMLREERATQKGGMLNYTILTVDFDLVSSVDASRHTVRTVGEAMDSADKSSNKAQSAALKYAALQVFMIPTEGDNDADAVTHDVAPKPVKQEAPDFIAEDDVTLAIQLCEALGGSQAQEICKAYKIKTLSQLTKKQGVAVIERLQTKLAEKAKAETNTMASAG